MNRRAILPRLAGIVGVALGIGAALMLRAASFDAPQDGPTALEFVLVLASFVLTLGGLVLALNGTKPWGSRDGAARGALPRTGRR